MGGPSGAAGRAERRGREADGVVSRQRRESGVVGAVARLVGCENRGLQRSMRTNTLATVPSSELTSRLYELRGEERRLLVEFLVYLGEVDRRRLYAELGFSSLFVFLSQHLGYSSSAAYRRSTAARLVARFPVVAEYLGDGRLSLTTLVELRDVLDEPHLF